LRPVYNESKGIDGYVSLEANPHLAYDTQGTIDEIHRLRERVNRPNVMYKVPATSEGIEAIEQLISEGVNVNITLMFSMKHYEDVANAYIKGLEKFAANGGDVSTVASVASFFISRVDVKLDPQVSEKGKPELAGKIGIANSKVVYQRFKELFGDARWQKLADKGARVQRPLWASTSTKNPDYPDLLYVDTLIGPHTVNTLPPETLEAFLDHGTVVETVEDGLDEAKAQLAALKAIGIDLIEVGEELQSEGVDKFNKPFDSLIATINEQRKKLVEA
jgi:transaldolase